MFFGIYTTSVLEKTPVEIKKLNNWQAPEDWFEIYSYFLLGIINLLIHIIKFLSRAILIKKACLLFKKLQ